MDSSWRRSYKRVTALSLLLFSIFFLSQKSFALDASFFLLPSDDNFIIYKTEYNKNDWSGFFHSYNTIDTPSSLWKASILDYEKRNILTSDGEYPTPFFYDKLNTIQKEQVSSEDVVLFIRGKNFSFFRNRTVFLGDIINSTPVQIKDSVYIGANDGMLHCFNTQSGLEKFAYIPNHFFKNLKSLSDKNYTHNYFIDGSVSSNENLLVAGYGRGGKGYFALNVQNINELSAGAGETLLKSIFKWEFPKADDSDMGFSFSKAEIGNSYIDKKIVIFGNGYNSINGKATLYILNAENGDLIKKIDTNIGSDNGLFSPAIVDSNGDNKIDFVYAGDLKGNLWKFDLRDQNSSNWKVFNNKPIFETSGKPITSSPEVLRHPLKKGFLLLFGTGRNLNDSDENITQTQSFYAVWDSNVLGFSLGAINNQTGKLLSYDNLYLLKHEIKDDSSSNISYTTKKEIEWGYQDSSKTTFAGWFIELGSKERILKSPIVSGTKVFIESTIPSTKEFFLTELDIYDGSKRDETAISLNGTRKIVTQDGVILPNRIKIASPNTLLTAQKNGTTKIYILNSETLSLEKIVDDLPKNKIFYWKEL